KELADSRTVEAPTRPLDAYTGRFYNAAETLFLEIFNEGGSLRMRFFGVEEEEFVLYSYQEDSFTWLPSHDELARREHYVIEFGS
ncbi:hypothetical protein B0T14DRAFT_385012, partial [Immersiella caudata]